MFREDLSPLQVNNGRPRPTILIGGLASRNKDHKRESDETYQNDLQGTGVFYPVVADYAEENPATQSIIAASTTTSNVERYQLRPTTRREVP